MSIAQDLLYKLDLSRGTQVVNLTTPLVEGDKEAHTFHFALLDSGEVPNLSSVSCAGYFARHATKDHQADTIPVTGSVTGNTVIITLSESCYSRSTYFTFVVRLTDLSTGQKRSIAIIRGMVVNSADGDIIDPDGSIPSLDELFAQIAAMEQATAAAEAVVSEYNGKVAEQDASIAALTQDIDNGFALPVTWEDGAYINTKGEVIALENYSIATVDVRKIVQVGFETVMYDHAAAVFVRMDGGVASALPLNESRANPYTVVANVPSPYGAYLKISCLTANKADLTAKITNIPAQVLAMMGGVGAVTVLVNQNLTDANDALPNTIYSIQQSGGIVANTPAAQGTLMTFSYSSSEVGGRVQLFVDSENRFFWRIRWAAWTEWREAADAFAVGGGVSVEWVDGYYVNGHNNGEIPSYNGTPGMSYAKLDVSAIRGCVVKMTTNTQSRATYAFYDAGNKCVAHYDQEFVEAAGINTFEAVVPFTAKYLCVSSYTDKKTDFRIRVGDALHAASRLHEHYTGKGNPLEHVTRTPGLAAIFRKFCCIGDSLASGEHEYLKEDGSVGYIDLYEYSWGQYMARAVGGNCYNLSKGGATTRTWLAEFASKLTESLSDCYIIALGVNDSNTDSRNVPVGSLADCHATDHTQNADSYYGNYDQIIRRIKAVQPKAKIFCVTNPQGGANDAYNSTYNKAVRDMVAKHDNCYLIDLWEYAPVYDSAFREMYFNGGHMNAAGYLYTAHMFMSYIDWHVKNNPTDFAEVAFIGTDYSRQ